MIAALLAAATCVSGPSEPIDDARFRPTPSFTCPFRAAEMDKRLTSLLALPAGEIEATSLERLLSLPRLPTMYDDARGLAYAANVTGPDGWRVRIGGDETFWPRTGEAEFGGSAYPRRLRHKRRGEITLNLNVFSPIAKRGGGALARRICTIT